MIDVLENSVMITGFVFVMMLVIEYVNVLTSGVWGTRLARSRWIQYILAAALGALPGCLGSFAAVAMFSHRIIGLGAVITAMIATSGDEAFVMLAMIPGQFGYLAITLCGIGIIAGIVTDSVTGRIRFLERLHCDGLELHYGHEGECFPRGKILTQWRYCTAARGILAVVLLLLLLAVLFGQTGHHHGEEHLEGTGWIRTTILFTSILALFIVATVPDHFLDEHLWRHIAMRHVPRIFLWSFGALLVMHLLTSRLPFELEAVAQRGRWIVLGVACLAGLIPQSGPHLIFVTLFAGGYIPLSVLLANSIVQDGHGMLPLLAHSRRLFFLIKGVNLLFGLAVGAAALAAGM